jgi:hypothetical protein
MPATASFNIKQLSVADIGEMESLLDMFGKAFEEEEV